MILAAGLGGMTRELAQNCELLDLQGTVLKLRLPPSHKHLVMMASNVSKLQEALSAHFAQTVRVNIEVGDVASQTPAQRNEVIRKAQHADAVASLESDPFVQELIERCDATLVESSVKPLLGEM
jgi:DNA polymerase-3 subunit gamma/tau